MPKLRLDQISYPQKTVGQFYRGDTGPNDTVKISYDGILFMEEMRGKLIASYVEMGDSVGFFS